MTSKSSSNVPYPPMQMKLCAQNQHSKNNIHHLNHLCFDIVYKIPATLKCDMIYIALSITWPSTEDSTAPTRYCRSRLLLTKIVMHFEILIYLGCFMLQKKKGREGIPGKAMKASAWRSFCLSLVHSSHRSHFSNSFTSYL